MSDLPRKIHFCWFGDSALPDWAERNISMFRTLNPDHEIKLHSEESVMPELRRAWEMAADNSSRSDLLRYSVLAREGGWYFDVDFWPFRPISEAVKAWGIDGRRLTIARQHGNRNASLLYAACPLAIEPDNPIIRLLIDRCRELAERVAPGGKMPRCAFGPQLILYLANEHPELVQVMDWPWWFPSAIDDAPADYQACAGGDERWARAMCAQTGGQLPFAMHMWASAGKTFSAAPLQRKKRALLLCEKNGIELTNNSEKWPNGHALACAKRGLEAAGYAIDCYRPDRIWPRNCGTGIPDLAVVWNGRREPQQSVVCALKSAGVPVWHIEHGFLGNRREWVQVDRSGFLQFASWANDWAGEPPADAEAGFRAACPADLLAAYAQPKSDTREGNVLLIGQVAGDTQLDGAEITGPLPLEKHVHRALPQGMAAVMRPHPVAKHVDDANVTIGRTFLPRSSGTLAEAVNAAKFAVTINSNSIVECLLLGCPVLAFGPSTAIAAGVVKRATLATLPVDLEAMASGWRPDPEAVQRYLYWLACRQYNTADLATAEFWEKRIQEV